MSQDDAQHLRRVFVEQLCAAGAITSPQWREAFLGVPRHHFTPAFWRRGPDGGRRHIDGADPAQRDEWLRVVYSDDSLVTQHNRGGAATSSSTQPSLMAAMLDALDVTDDVTRVLEIGAGTGYNAALLCHRLGPERVTTIEVDPSLAEGARAALAGLGYRPNVVCGDGLAGYPPDAPYDRIIATCSTDDVPRAWLEQTKPGGVVLANLGGCVARLLVDEHHNAAGRMLPEFAGFIEARSADGPKRLTPQQVLALAAGAGERQPLDLDPREFANPELQVLIGLLLPDLTWVGRTHSDSDLSEHLWADAATSSWARLVHDSRQAPHLFQGGPRRLGDDLADIHRQWVAADRPDHSRLGLTVARQRTLVWRDAPSRVLGSPRAAAKPAATPG